MAKTSTRFMQRVYTVLTPTSLFLLGLTVLLTLLFIVLQPRVLNTLFPGLRHTVLQSYLTSVQKEGTFSLRKYWEFRERYSLGSFTFDPRVVTFGETQIITALPATQSALLKYTSPQLESTDYITSRPPRNSPQKEADRLVALYSPKESNWKEIFSGDRVKIFTDSQGTYMMIFARTIDEMRTVNGFFDFTSPEIKVLVSTMWLNITVIHDN